MCALAAKGAGILESGVTEYGPWCGKLLADFGEGIADKVRIHLPGLYSASQDEVRKRQARLQAAERAPVTPAPSVGTQANGDTGQARPVAVAKPATEMPVICAQTNSQPSEEPPRQIPASTGPRPKWRMRRLGIGTAAALAIIAGVVNVRMWRDGAQPIKPQALDWLAEVRARAEKGDVNAQTSLALQYAIGNRKDYAKEAYWYRKAAEQGSAEAQYFLGYCYERGEGVQQDYGEAVKWFRKAAEQGDGNGQCGLGMCYEEGHGVPKDYVEAVKWYRKAAEQGDESAQYSLGECYSEGLGVRQDYAEAIKWFQKSAEQGNPWAQPQLGCCYCPLAYCYYTGQGVPQDYTEAVKWFRKAAEQGNAWGQNNIALCYYKGYGVTRDYVEAVKWYRKAAEQGDADGQGNLGGAYADGNGVQQDLEEAVKWFRKAAEQGNGMGQGNLGAAYANGQGVQLDYTEAVKWFRKAADQENDYAQYNLGVSYERGHGVGQDYTEAVKWYRKAAEQRNAAAQDNLGLCYYNGHGVQQDYAQAAKWYREAAEQGNAWGQANLGLCYYNGKGVQQDYTEAARWNRKAAEQGHAGAQHNLGVDYSEGKGVPQNDIEAYKWFSLAAAQGQEGSANGRDWIAQRMARAEVVEGQRRADAFVAKKEGGGDGASGISPIPEIAEGRRCAGTGFFVTEDGYFVTCEHVVRGATSFHVRSPSGSLPARLIKKDRTIDVAVLKVDGSFRALPVAAQPRVRLGEAVFTVGFPNPALQGVEPKLTRGEISSMAGARDNPRYYQISVPVQPGNSGGALLDECGNAVGVVTSRLDDIATFEESGALPQNVSYAVKSSVVYAFLSRVPELSGKLKAAGTARDREAASGAAERTAVLVVAE